MHSQNLGSLPKSRFITGLVLPYVMTTLDEVFMKEKFCNIHNVQFSIKKISKKLFCKKCSSEKAKDYYWKNKEKNRIKSIEFLNSIKDDESIKKCKIHGILYKQDVFVKSLKCIICVKCQRERIKSHRLKNRESLLTKERQYREDNIERFRERDRVYKSNDYKKRKYIYVERSKRFYSKNSEKIRNYRLNKSYGIDLSTYEKMLKEQNGLCYICNEPETALSHKKDKIKSLSVDHNHTTGKVRRLLCVKCNCLIGYSRESIDLLQKVIDYFKLFNAEFENDIKIK